MVWARPANLTLMCKPVQDTNHLAQLAREQFTTNPSFWTRGLIPKLASLVGWLKRTKNLAIFTFPCKWAKASATSTSSQEISSQWALMDLSALRGGNLLA